MSGTVSLNPNATTRASLPTINGVSGTITLPAGSGTVTVSASSGSTSTAATSRTTEAVGTLNVYYSVSISTPLTVTLASIPAFSISLPSTIPAANQAFYYGLSNPTATTPGVSYTTEGPAVVIASTVTFAATPGPLVLNAGTSYTFLFYSTTAPTTAGSLYAINGGTVSEVPASSSGTVTSPQFTVPALPDASSGQGYPHSPPSHAVDVNGNVYIPNGNVVAVFGPKSTTPVETLSVPEAVESVAVGKDDTVYVLGQTNLASTVYVFAPNATKPTSVITGGSGGALQPFTGNYTFANRLIVDALNHLYVADDVKYGRDLGANIFDGVFDVPLNNNPPYNVTLAGPTGFGPAYFGDTPLDIALSPDGHKLFIANDEQIEVWVGSSDGFHFSNFLGSTDDANGNENGYESVTVDSAGTIYAKRFDRGSGSQVDVFAAPGTTTTVAPLRSFTFGFPVSRIVAGP